MATINFYQTDEIDNGLKLENGKLGIKLDASGNVQLSTSDAGLKADVALPAQQVAFTDAQIADNVITFSKTDGSTATLTLPELPVDVKLGNAELTADNKLKLTMSDGTIIEVELSALIPPAKTAEQLLDEILNDQALKNKLLAGLRGDEIRNAKNDLLGYALPA